MCRSNLTFRPIKLETVVVMRGEKVAGTIKRYRAHKGCIVSVPGVISAAGTGGSFFRTIDDAKAAVLAADCAVSA
jgi:hypothetical protein